MKKTLPYFLVVSLLLCLTTSLVAQTITGKVTDTSTNEPISGVVVLAKGTTTAVLTDMEGVYTLAVSEDATVLRFSKVGYRTKEVNIEGQKTVDVELVRGLEINQLAVSASGILENTTTAIVPVTVLSGDAMELQLATTGDPINLLKNTQGVSVIQNGLNKSTITLRGQAARNTTRTLFLKDYRILNDLSTNTFDSERSPIIPIDIERVEVVRGNSGALWGSDASAGIIHYISKDAFRYSGVSAEVSYGNSFGESATGQAANVTKVDMRYAGHFKNKLGWKVIASYRTGNDFLLDSTDEQSNYFGTLTPSISDYMGLEVSGLGYENSGDGQWTDYSTAGNTLDMGGHNIGTVRTTGVAPFNLISAFHSLNVEGTLEFRPTDNISIALVPSFGQSKGNFGTSNLFSYEFKEQFNTQLRINIGKLFAAANYRTAPGFDGDLNNPGWEATYYNDSWIDPGTSQYTDFMVRYPITIAKKTNILLGADMKALTRSYATDFPDNTANTFNVPGVFEEGNDVRVLGGFAHITHDFSDKLKAVGAFRVDNYNNYGTAFSPKLALVYAPRKEAVFRVSFNQSNTAPEMNKTYYQAARNFRRRNIKGRLVRNIYGAGEAITFNNPVTGLNDNNELAFIFDGTDIPFQELLDYMVATTPFTQVVSLAGTMVDGTTVGTLYNIQNERENTLITNTAQMNTTKAKLETSQSFEIGYKGVIEKKISLSIDAYYNIDRNVLSEAMALSSGVDFPTLQSDFRRALLDAGVDDTRATRAAREAYNLFGNQVSGIVIADQHQALGITDGVTYGFRTYDKIQYFGLNISADYYVNEKVSIFANWSYVNQTDFTSEDIGNNPELESTFYLNIPKKRVRGGLNYGEGISTGFIGNLAVQYNSGFKVGYSDFVGEINAYTTVDAMVGYKLGKGVTISVSGMNIFNAEVRSLPYLPIQGAMFIGTLRYML